MNPAEIIKDGQDELQQFKLPVGWVVNEAADTLAKAKTTLRDFQLLGAFMYANNVHILGGDDRAGKSKFAISMLASLLRKEELIPGVTVNEYNKPLVCGVLEFELTDDTQEQRHGKLYGEFAGKNRLYTIRIEADKAANVCDRVKHILDVIEAAVNLYNLDVVLWDNPMAWLGDDISKNEICSRLYWGLKAIIERRNKLGFILSFTLLMHLTKSAQDRREELGAVALSRKNDIRGGGALQSLSASVMELRQSGMDEEQAILIHFNTRHAKGENMASHGKGYAFNVTHTPGDWAHEFLEVVELKHHFGKNLSEAPADVQRAANTDASLVQAILNLNAKGKDNTEIKRTIESVYGKAISRQRIIDVLKAHGRKSPLSKQVKK